MTAHVSVYNTDFADTFEESSFVYRCIKVQAKFYPLESVVWVWPKLAANKFFDCYHLFREKN